MDVRGAHLLRELRKPWEEGSQLMSRVGILLVFSRATLRCLHPAAPHSPLLRAFAGCTFAGRRRKATERSAARDGIPCARHGIAPLPNRAKTSPLPIQSDKSELNVF